MLQLQVSLTVHQMQQDNSFTNDLQIRIVQNKEQQLGEAERTSRTARKLGDDSDRTAVLEALTQCVGL